MAFKNRCYNTQQHHTTKIAIQPGRYDLVRNNYVRYTVQVSTRLMIEVCEHLKKKQFIYYSVILLLRS